MTRKRFVSELQNGQKESEISRIPIGSPSDKVSRHHTGPLDVNSL